MLLWASLLAIDSLILFAIDHFSFLREIDDSIRKAVAFLLAIGCFGPFFWIIHIANRTPNNDVPLNNLDAARLVKFIRQKQAERIVQRFKENQTDKRITYSNVTELIDAIRLGDIESDRSELGI